MFVSQELEPVPTIHHYSNRDYHKICAHLIASLSSIFLNSIIHLTLLFMSWCQERAVCSGNTVCRVFKRWLIRVF